MSITIETNEVTLPVKNALDIIERFKSSGDEFKMLKGVIFAYVSIDCTAAKEFQKIICMATLTARMDDIVKGESK